MMDRTRYDSVFRADLFAGRVALVTGGGTGIGRCIAHELAHLGATVVISGRREAPLQATADEIAAAGGACEIATLNIRDEEAVDEVVGALAKRHGRLDLLVNNAGGQFASPAALMRAKGWRAVIDTNLNGTFFVSQAAFKHTMARRGGAIVNITADFWNGFPGMAHTGAARAGVTNLTKTLAIEWAAAGVRVNAVAPGVILSSGMKNYPKATLKMAAEVMTKNPSSRAGTEAEVSAAVVFLLSPAAAYVTGETIRVDGASSLSKAPFLPWILHDKMTPYDGFHLEADLPELLQQKKDG